MSASYEMFQTDALIIGGGLAGLMAARSLSLPDGIQLSILSMGSGASPHVHGFNIPLHNDDSVECFIKDTLKSGRYQNNEELVNELCCKSLELMPILDSIGIQLDREGDDYNLLRPLGASFPRVATAGNAIGAEIMGKIQAELSTHTNVAIHNSLRALRLMVNDGTVQGVLAFDTIRKTLVCIESKAVILATGGFSKIFPFSTNTSDISGDGIAMAYDAGASLVDLEFVQFEPTVAVYPPQISGIGIITTMFYDGAVLKNIDGERFMLKYDPLGEKVDKDVLSRRIYQEICAGKGTAHGGVYFDASGVGAKKLNELYPTCVKRYAGCGIDITKEPVEVAPAPHTSLGGVIISPDCSTSVSGLFACGEIVGGIHGANRIGGNAGLETLVFGKRAGEAASMYLSKEKNSLPSALLVKQWEALVDSFVIQEDSIIENCSPGCERLAAMRARMEQLLSDALNVLRCEDKLKMALDELAQAITELDGSGTIKNVDELYIKLRLRNDLVTAYLFALSALERTESVGCHIRTNLLADNGKRYSIRISKGTDGVNVEKAPLVSDVR